MSELIIVLKSVLFATIVAVVLQFQVQGKSIETHMMSFAGSQFVQAHLQLAASGAVALGRQAKEKIESMASDVMSRFDSNTSSTSKK